jgi:hypothetical protein
VAFKWKKTSRLLKEQTRCCSNLSVRVKIGPGHWRTKLSFNWEIRNHHLKSRAHTVEWFMLTGYPNGSPNRTIGRAHDLSFSFLRHALSFFFLHRASSGSVCSPPALPPSGIRVPDQGHFERGGSRGRLYPNCCSKWHSHSWYCIWNFRCNVFSSKKKL